MVESLVVTLFPISFLIFLFGTGASLRRRGIDVDGVPPINRELFYASKCSIVILWTATILHSWGVDLSLVRGPSLVRWIALGLWASGFVLLLVGRFGLGDSLRMGSAKEAVELRTSGPFCYSRNPMYCGLYATSCAAALYTWNPILLLLAGFVIAVHHRIVLAEEEHLGRLFGGEYAEYCRRVRRYV